MPRYFIDVYDGDTYQPDGIGRELPDASAARWHAIDALPDVARSVLPDGDRRVMMADVKDEDGKQIFRAILTLVAEWVGETPPIKDAKSIR